MNDLKHRRYTQQKRDALVRRLFSNAVTATEVRNDDYMAWYIGGWNIQIACISGPNRVEWRAWAWDDTDKRSGTWVGLNTGWSRSIRPCVEGIAYYRLTGKVKDAE
jgi:hypothetical protein